MPAIKKYATDEERREARRQRSKITKNAAYAALTPEERAAAYQRIKEKREAKLAAMSPEEREAYQARKREQQRRTPEEKKARNSASSEHRRSRSPEEREAELEKQRQYQAGMRSRAGMLEKRAEEARAYRKRKSEYIQWLKENDPISYMAYRNIKNEETRDLYQKDHPIPAIITPYSDITNPKTETYEPPDVADAVINVQKAMEVFGMRIDEGIKKMKKDAESFWKQFQDD
jgi:hypothetical protein